ncbi:hypothetical protein K1T34_17690 [Amycolatopsis sp. DSM 110486]|nr:hypothetical protein K1T34_17690 [Amycolatopsis sp. DSM 110486]
MEAVDLVAQVHVALAEVAGRVLQPDAERVGTGLGGRRAATLPGSVHLLVQVVDLGDTIAVHRLEFAGGLRAVLKRCGVTGVDLLVDRVRVDRAATQVR